MRILIAGLGYANMSDYSFGDRLIALMKKRTLPEGVEVDDWSYGPIFITHSLAERAPYDRLILVAAVDREKAPGTVTRSRWTHELPPKVEIQARIIEAATGVISLENLLVVGTHFEKFPADVIAIELQPVHEEFGSDLSPEFESLLIQLSDEIEAIWSQTDSSLPPLDRYEFIIPDAKDRPTGWTIREGDDFWNDPQ